VNSKIDDYINQQYKNVKRTDLLLNDRGDNMENETPAKEPSEWKDLKCTCEKWLKGDSKPFGYLVRKFENTKFVIFIRQCKNCQGLRANLAESKPQEKPKQVLIP